MTSSKLSSLPGITAALVPSAALAVQEMPPAPSGINTLPVTLMVETSCFFFGVGGVGSG